MVVPFTATKPLTYKDRYYDPGDTGEMDEDDLQKYKGRLSTQELKKAPVKPAGGNHGKDA